MKRRLAQGSALISLAWALSVACAGNDSKGGPPQAPCNDESKTPLLCGSACLNRCGCTECAPGETRQIGGVSYECAGKCLTPQSAAGGAGGGGATGGSSAGGTGGLDCGQVDCETDPPLCSQCSTCACCTCTSGQTKLIGGLIYQCTAQSCYQSATDGG